MRLDDVSPRTWLLGAVAGWAVLATRCSRSPAWAAGSYRCRTMPRCCNPCPKPTRAPPERLSYSQYAEISVRHVLLRSPAAAVLARRRRDTSTTSITSPAALLVPQVKLAMVQPAMAGDPEQVKLGDAVGGAGVAAGRAEPAHAVSEGRAGRRRWNCACSTAMVANRRFGQRHRRHADQWRAAAGSACRRGRYARRQNPRWPGRAEGGRDPATQGDNTEQRMEALRKRIEQRRAQLRATAAGSPPTDDADAQTDNRRVDAMKLRQSFAAAFAACLLALLAGCASMPPPIVPGAAAPASRSRALAAMAHARRPPPTAASL